MNWTDERVELLKKMWEEGMSASQIAAQLGGVSRNAVIGKVHRLKISRLEKAPAATAKKENLVRPDSVADNVPTSVVAATAPVNKTKTKVDKAVTKKVEEKTDKVTPPPAAVNNQAANDTIKETVDEMVVVGKEKDKPAMFSQQAKAMPQPESERADEESASDEAVVVPISRRLSLLQLTENTCKWPIGDPLAADFHFCGAKTSEGSPYCSYHSKIAFQPVTDRRRVRV